MVEDGAFSHFLGGGEILNREGYLNRITGSKVMVIFLNGWILPVGGVAFGRVCSCSLRSRLVLFVNPESRGLTPD